MIEMIRSSESVVWLDLASLEAELVFGCPARKQQGGSSCSTMDVHFNLSATTPP
jgi:hypothetical protein